MTKDETNDETPRTHSIELEVEVPGTPEQVWQAIATQSGIEAWFMPNRFEGREGGAVAFDLGRGLQETGHISSWEPPQRFKYEEEWEGQAFATEFLVEARSGGSCVVRLVSSITGDGDWDDEIEGMRGGWTTAFKMLRLYLEEFAGQQVSTVRVVREVHRPPADAWAELVAALGIGRVAEGARVAAGAPGAPALAGEVLWTGEAERRDRRKLGVELEVPGGVMLRADAPAPGGAIVAVVRDGEHVNALVHLYLFGDDAPAVAARERAAWRAWLEARFPAPQPADAT